MATRKLVIAGGGTAGWMTALMARRVLGRAVEVELVESDQIGIVGVGEATIPPIQTYNRFVGLDERELLRETHGTIKLAIRFEGWRRAGESYYHTFGAPGANLGFCTFQHYLARANRLGDPTSIWDYDLNYLCCEAGKFNKMATSDPILDIPYAYHFDAALYGRYLRRLAEGAGVKRREGVIRQVVLDSASGHVRKLQLASGAEIEGDVFVDCTGLQGLLLQQALGVAFEDWGDWIPSDRAIAVQSESASTLVPYTRSIAHAKGWQWQIPLTHRTGNGLVYSSRFMSDDEAMATLLANLPGAPIAEPRLIRFRTGRTARQWHRNVIAIGLSSGFLEPLESTSIHLIQAAAVRLMRLFPHDGISPAAVERFNEESQQEFETIRDFIILHYHANEREDSAFWQQLRNMRIPDRLQQKINLFRESGTIFNDTQDIFRDSSWVQVMMGQGISPGDYHPAADAMPDAELRARLAQLLAAKRQLLPQMLSHRDFLKRYAGV